MNALRETLESIVESGRKRNLDGTIDAYGLLVLRTAEKALREPVRNCDAAEDWLKDLYSHFKPPKGMREMPPEWVDAISAFCRWLVSPVGKPAKPMAIPDADPDCGETFYIVDMGDGIRNVTRSRMRAHPDFSPLTRRLLYEKTGRHEEALCNYTHQFMCCDYPSKPDPARPSKDEWMDEKPFPHEVDEFVTDMLWPDQYRKAREGGHI